MLVVAWRVVLWRGRPSKHLDIVSTPNPHGSAEAPNALLQARIFGFAVEVGKSDGELRCRDANGEE